MTTTAAPAPPAASAARDVRRAWRDLRNPVLGGVAAGLAEHLAVPVLWVRVAFVVATFVGGSGVAAYAVLWAMLPAGPPPSMLAPGLESASRDGRRPGRRGRRLSDVGPVITLSALGVGAVFATGAVLGTGWWVWPLAIAVAGVALLWRQADEAQRERWLDATGKVDPVRVVLGGGGWAAWARIAVGLGLVVIAMVLFTLRDGSLSVARDATLAVVLAVGGIGIVAGPFVYRLMTELGQEREERVRTQERADVAAHLHDSVLQTLALIQKNPADAARLARAQERDLRAWLYAGESLDEATVASALRAAAAEIEDAYGITVDVVAVGDCDYDEHLRPVVLAAREATTNAAKHAGVPRVDVYAEITPTGVDVFVRDRGAGFDPAATPEDRLGVRRSIIDRMERHGGRAEIRSAPGEGTEVRLHLDRRSKESDE
ncbi:MULTISPECIES: ATP-binding protein [unclassified Nocardioides]|jgi:signal transduction histidine kinase/phage shock protein PspC (stress-responsive transcriptional regulator)|uniref:ATP-binding protein n=1 Tax=unclassified Nocardioides TaxID=2615069 RepID=UPI0007027FBD|nr:MULTISPECIES: ATP-binding protein [unclassified Nocardioides]KRC46558.1 ATPase [Nocardioides sp. Root79]KRC69901.1 ATPase [Nocardioides sp. Root240]